MTIQVYVAPTLPDSAGGAVLASLPLSFAAVGREADADVLVLDGREPDWPARLTPGPRRVVLVDPVPPASDLSPVAAFVLDTPWGSNPVCPAVARALVAAAWERLECRVVAPPLPGDRDRCLEAELLRVVSLARAVGVPLDALRVVVRTAAGLTAQGTAGGKIVDIDVTVTEAQPRRVRLRALTDDGDIAAVIPDPTTARPAELVVTDARGATTCPTLWESAHRATWRRLLAHDNADDSAGFAHDLALVTATRK
jgi:hypothetical protein